MEIQKFRHSCVVLMKHDQSIVIDPGDWSTDFITPQNVVAVIVTHEHGDHFSLDHIADIMINNPAAKIFAPSDVITKLASFPTAVAVNDGQINQIGDFTLTFVGKKHAVIHPDYPACDNIGVLVDDGDFYYPGDSFTLPTTRVKVLAVPASAPWMKTAEAIDFIAAVKPEKFFMTHDAILSTEGKAVTTAWFIKAAENNGAELLSF